MDNKKNAKLCSGVFCLFVTAAGFKTLSANTIKTLQKLLTELLSFNLVVILDD